MIPAFPCDSFPYMSSAILCLFCVSVMWPWHNFSESRGFWWPVHSGHVPVSRLLDLWRMNPSRRQTSSNPHYCPSRKCSIQHQVPITNINILPCLSRSSRTPFKNLYICVFHQIPASVSPDSLVSEVLCVHCSPGSRCTTRTGASCTLSVGNAHVL